MLSSEPAARLWAVCVSLLRHKGKMALFFVLVLGGVTAVTLLSPKMYRAQGKLLVRLGRENVILDPTATLGQEPVIAVPTSRETEINSVLEILTSRILLDKVIDSVGVAAVLGQAPAAPLGAALPPVSPDDRARALAVLRKRLSAEAVKHSNIIVLTFTGPDPETAQAIVSRLMDFYLDQHVRLHRTAGAHRFLQEQTERLQAQLTATEEKFRDLKASTGLIAPEAQRQALVTRAARLEDEGLQAASASAAAEAEVAALQQRLEKMPRTEVLSRTAGLPNPALDQMRAQFYTLQLKQREAELRYPEAHPEVKQARQLTETARALLEKEDRDREQVVTGASKLYEETQLELARQQHQLAALRGRAEALKLQAAEVRAECQTLNQQELQLARLQRDLELQSAQYRKYADNLEQARIDQTLEQERIASINVVQPAITEPKPVSPSVPFNLALGFACAACGALALAFLAESLGRSSRAPAEADRGPGRPVLTALPDGGRLPALANGRESAS